MINLNLQGNSIISEACFLPCVNKTKGWAVIGELFRTFRLVFDNIYETNRTEYNKTHSQCQLERYKIIPQYF